MAQRYVSYRRVSTEMQRDGLGLEAQTAIIKHFYPQVEKDFCDIKSGGTADREQLKKAIKYCKEHDAIMVVAKADRLSRNVRDALAIYDDLKQNIRFCDIPGSPPERFILTIHWAISERERELISIRIRAALAIKKAKGEPLGLHMTHNKKGEPMDQNRLRKKEYRILAGEAAKIEAQQNENNIRAREYAQSLRDSNATLDYIAHRLNQAKFASPQNKTWSKSTVHRLLKKAS